MANTYTWSPRVERLIDGLSLNGGGIPVDGTFWSRVEMAGDGALPPEVLAYLTRLAFQSGQRSAAERLFSVLWDRYAGHVVIYARRYGGRLQRMVTVEDVVTDVFMLLCRRLREAPGVTFYEACFFAGLKRLTLDKVQRIDDEPLVSLTTTHEDDDDEHQQDVEDREAVDPLAHSEEIERREDLKRALPECLHGLPPRVQDTARLLMAGKSEKEVASALGVSTRMVTNYKATLRQALAGYA